jgi:aminoglycoside 6'-N-acetyltransferase I
LTRLHPDIPLSEFEADIVHWRRIGDPFVCFLAMDGDRPAGLIDARVRNHAEGAPNLKAAYVEDLWVDRAYRRHGLASRLLAEVEAWARGLGLDWIGSDTVPENRASRRWHAANGFRELERLVVFGKPLGQKPSE